jgi:N-acetylmuramoyl-L-alanine amidase
MSGLFKARLPRRGLFAGALAAGAAVVASGGRAAAQADTAPRGRMAVHQLTRSTASGPVPEVLAAAGEAATNPGFPIGYLGITWSGEATGGRVRFRTEAGWGAWRPVEQHDAGGDRQAALIAAGGALAAEVDPAASAGDVQLLAINTIDGPASGLPFAAPSRLYGCRYRSRAGWGADESWRFGDGGEELWPAEFHNVQTLTVHHTATTVDDADPAATVRAVYLFQAVTQAWGDIGYHLLIDGAGVVYEGRYSGPDGLPVFRVATGRPRLVDAGHALGFNPGNVGVVLLGDLTSVQPTAAARRALVRVLASLARTAGLNPLGRTNYVNPVTGATRTVHTISGHRDWNATQCPGNSFYPTLPALRSEVADLLERGVPIR